MRIACDPVRGRPWTNLPVTRYAVAEAGRALDDVTSLRTIKALIDPRVPA